MVEKLHELGWALHFIATAGQALSFLLYLNFSCVII